ncbi:MAG: aminoacyl-tRNA deacylase [Chloroflexota bacterium]
MVDETEKTNAMRILEVKGIPYEAYYFSKEIHSAQGVAEVVGIPANRVYKTLVTVPTEGRAQPILAVVPGDRELDLKALATVAGEKKVRMASLEEAEDFTDLQVGGISPLALLQKAWPVFLDASAKAHDAILVSAGKRGINLKMAVEDLLSLTDARLAAISRKPATDLH